jgi:hypothetical protein
MREHSALKGLAEKWAGAKAAERANAQSYLIELCEALGVGRPQPAGSGYEFELPIKVIARDGTEAQNFIDLYNVKGTSSWRRKTPTGARTQTSCSGGHSGRLGRTPPTSPAESPRRTSSFSM